MSDGSGWFVVNARAAQWRGGNGRTPICTFEGEERFPQLGINVTVIEPGQVATLYHAEEAQEDFLVISGTCVLLIEGERQPLGPWDFFHCPAGTPHALLPGDARCIVVQVGARPPGSIAYPELALAEELGVAAEPGATSVAEAYGSRRRVPVPYEGWLD